MYCRIIEKARKLHFRTTHQGLPISIENRRGSIRRGTDPGGQLWETKMQHHYGYIRGTQGTDGDALDCYVGNCKEARHVYVINQMEPPDFRHTEEQKAMLGFKKRKHARRAFRKHYNDPRFLGTIHKMTVEEFRQKLRTTRQHPRLLRGT
jgi:Inorganic Pyrophosphatase